MIGFWRAASPEQRRAFVAAWLGWILDAFDFTILFLVMPALGREFGVGMADLGGVVTATLLGRVLGGVVGGWLCDRFGRRRLLMASLAFYGLFAMLVGFSQSYRQVLVLRFIFGVGMGAEWSAGTALVMEHWPAPTRGLASGLLQGSWAIGYFLAALAHGLIVPAHGWRPLFYLAAAPALLALFVRAGVRESPSWRRSGGGDGRASIVQLLDEPQARRSTLVGSLVLGGGFFTYYSLATFYPTLIQRRGLAPGQLTVLVMLFNAGMLAGAVTCGALSERIGRRAAIATWATGTLAAVWLYLLPEGFAWLALGSAVGGFVGTGWTGATPSYLAEQFPTRMRASGLGTVYHAGALIGALAPRVVPLLEARWTLPMAMGGCACAGALVVMLAVWLQSERRGAEL